MSSYIFLSAIFAGDNDNNAKCNGDQQCVGFSIDIVGKGLNFGWSSTKPLHHHHHHPFSSLWYVVGLLMLSSLSHQLYNITSSLVFSSFIFFKSVFHLRASLLKLIMTHEQAIQERSRSGQGKNSNIFSLHKNLTFIIKICSGLI